LNVPGEIIKGSRWLDREICGRFIREPLVLCANEQTIEPAARKVAT
jgi:hypothetical protein